MTAVCNFPAFVLYVAPVLSNSVLANLPNWQVFSSLLLPIVLIDLLHNFKIDKIRYLREGGNQEIGFSTRPLSAQG